MAGSKDPTRYSSLFAKRLPGTTLLFGALVLMSLVVGMASVGLIHFRVLPTRTLDYVLVNGMLAGIIAILLPTVLTTFVIKAAKRRISTKHALFMSIIGAVSYSIFVLLGSLAYPFLGSAIATIIVLLGAASLFALWFFMNRVVLGLRKRAVPLAFVQPTFNIVLFAAASRFIFRFDTPFNTLIEKLFAGMMVFLVVSYALLYMFDRPLKKRLGVKSTDMFSGMLQNWLFDVNTAMAMKTKLGIKPDVRTDTIVLMRDDGSIKSVFFIPDIHYGPAGSLGASSFPYILESHINRKYKAMGFVMHTAATADRNPVSASQLGAVRKALNRGIKDATAAGESLSYSAGRGGSAAVGNLTMGRVVISTFTRAPKVTEDISEESARLFERMLERKGRATILIDAHNSRFESAPKSELAGVRYNSKCMGEYVNAIKNLKELHSSKRCMVGVSGVEIYNKLGMPRDLAPGKLNMAVFSFGAFKYAMLHFNSNNMLPSLRDEIISYVKGKYGVLAEVYTTDTHAVNSVDRPVENVLGRQTKFRMLKPLIDTGMESAIKDIGSVRVRYKRVYMKKFALWGPNVGDIMTDLMKSIIPTVRLLGPAAMVAGFLVAALVISLI